MDIDTGDQVTVDGDFDNIEDLNIAEVSDEEEDEPLIRTRRYQVESTKDKDKASKKTIKQAQPSVSPINEGLMEIDNNGQIAEDEEEDGLRTRARSRHYQSKARADKVPALAKTPGGRLVDQSAVSPNDCLGKGKGKALVQPCPSASPLGPSSLSSLANGGIESAKTGNDKFEASQSSSPAGQSTSQVLQQTTVAHGGLPVSVLQALDLTSVPLLHKMKLAIINELVQQDALTAKKMLQLDKRVTKTVDDLHEKVKIKEVHWTEDAVLKALEKRVEENMKWVDICIAQNRYIRNRLGALETAEKERQGILTQIMEIAPKIN
jgi:hypothetical protein